MDLGSAQELSRKVTQLCNRVQQGDRVTTCQECSKGDCCVGQGKGGQELTSTQEPTCLGNGLLVDEAPNLICHSHSHGGEEECRPRVKGLSLLGSGCMKAAVGRTGRPRVAGMECHNPLAASPVRVGEERQVGDLPFQISAPWRDGLLQGR